ncbi:Piso0_002196 [Millerozyma farinosa CBS 7064]|uniref:Piso0_002196 protein n=1 Tax=Pichia sorbitophila (strain ATCC MYA-4447 / BCRC 22081 / CBS 7064 / NBRC 10061 / NRRL Y-12695) TaxID=559304 RepID=G8YBY8_PICSO|nr:Piso0_002196 [Millerozyma farinosa CBS 7064]
MARKNKSGSKKRSTSKALNAFEIAERAESRNRNEASDSEDELPVRDGVVDARKFLGDNADYDSDAELEDEEIDSDEALGSEDEYDVLNSKFSQTIRDKEKKKKIKSKKGHTSDSSSSDDNSEEEGYSSIDESEFVPLSVAFDLNGDSSEKTNRNKGQKDVVLDDERDESQSEESSSDEDMSDSASDEEIFQDAESDNTDNVDLKNTLSYISSKKKGKEKRALINETAEENEHSVPTYGEKLSLKDMISAVDSNVAKDAVLIDLDKDSKALAAPPPKRVQERNERKAAYEIAKEEVSKWENTVQQNRQAEVLKFPLNPEHKADDSALTFKNIDKPSTDLERKVQNILTTSSLADENKEATFEEIAVAKLSPSEMKKRTGELRLMRELMFREEARAKRIKKIKSKAFRRIKKKEKLKNQQLVEGSDFESDNEEHDLKRARERMNLKHKTHSNWAKSMIKSGISKDASSREELEEMLRKGEALRSKQLGYNEGEQSDNSVSDIEQGYQDDKDNAEHEEEVRSSLGKGLMSMDFMKAAEERQKQQNINDLNEIANMDDIESEEGIHSSIHSSANQGRRVYTPSSSSLKSAMSKIDQQVSKEKSDDNAKSLENKMSKQLSSKGRAKSSKEKKSDDQRAQDKSENTDDSPVNPWLSGDIDSTHRSNKVVNVTKDSSDVSKAAHRISKKSQKGSNSKSSHGILINSNEYLDINAAENMNDKDRENNTFTQKDLVKEAFAGDDVVSEFQAEKRSVALEEGDKEVDLTLPGWGDWAGVNKKPKKRKIVKKIDGVVQSDKRRDQDLKNVIINEKVNKKNLKYQSSGVPYPFESREQYERTLRMPIGQEWTSRETHQKLVMPRVIVKQGTVIDPLKAPFK